MDLKHCKGCINLMTPGGIMDHYFCSWHMVTMEEVNGCKDWTNKMTKGELDKIFHKVIKEIQNG